MLLRWLFLSICQVEGEALGTYVIVQGEHQVRV